MKLNKVSNIDINIFIVEDYHVLVEKWFFKKYNNKLFNIGQSIGYAALFNTLN